MINSIKISGKIEVLEVCEEYKKQAEQRIHIFMDKQKQGKKKVCSAMGIEWKWQRILSESKAGQEFFFVWRSWISFSNNWDFDDFSVLCIHDRSPPCKFAFVNRLRLYIFQLKIQHRNKYTDNFHCETEYRFGRHRKKMFVFVGVKPDIFVHFISH